MQKLIESFESELHKIVTGVLYNRFKQEIRSEHLYFESIKKRVSEIQSSESDPDTIAEKTHEILSYDQYNKEGETARHFLAEAYEAIDRLIEGLPELSKVTQKAERFNNLETDSLWIKIGKLWKRVGFGFIDFPRKAGNLFRKNPKPKVYWSHRVPLRSMARHQFLGAFIESIIQLRSSYLVNLTQAYAALMEESVEQKEELNAGIKLKSELTKTRTNLKKDLLNKMEDALSHFHNTIDKVGTLELSPKHYKAKKVEGKIGTVNEKWGSEDKGWKNTFFLLFDEWRSDIEVFRLIQESKNAQEIYRNHQLDIFNESIRPHLDQIFEYLSTTESALTGANDQLSAVLKKSNYKAQKLLDEAVIPKLLETLASKNTINATSRLENSLGQSRKAMTSDFKLSKTAGNYDRPIADTDITTLSFYELITFEIAPALQSVIDQLKGRQLSELNNQIILAGDLDHMITFALSAAIDQLQEQGDSESVLKVALESLRRTRVRVNEIKETLEALFANYESLELALERYRKELSDLMVNENVRDIRLRITKAKAIQHTKAYRTEFIDLLKEVLLISKDRVFNVTRSFTSIFTAFRQRFILTSKKQQASREVSDFLSMSQDKINSLPIIYRNLYKIEPTKDMELFVGRQIEIKQLEKAYSSWTSGKAGSAILYAEKWSGLTSLLNYIQSTASFKHPVVRIKCVTGIGPQENFDRMIQQLFPDSQEIPSTIADGLNQSTPKIVILEDIQNLFLRKSTGFEEIKSLMELISKTAQKVFWIASCTIYTWTFLKKTIGIQDVFSYPIALKTPSEEELSAIIRKRNRVSGYNILFEGDETTLQMKSFKKLNTEEQQELLKKRFFKNLIEYSEGNISMTLMYWLLSTQSVDQNEFKISSFRIPDLSFIELLNMEKILSLHALILHDGLTVNQFSEVIRYSKRASFLLLSMMQEDGILIQKEELYLVNPLVYRSVISLLKSKNLIYS